MESQVKRRGSGKVREF